MNNIVNAQSVSLTAGVSTQEALKATVASQEILQAKMSAQADLKATVTAQNDLQGVVTAKGTLRGNVTRTSYVVDSELSEVSTNPVQNKVVTVELGKKIEKLNIAKNTDIDKLFK